MGLSKEKVCRKCKRFVLDEECPACREKNFSRSWKGVVVILDPNGSEIAQATGLNVPGKYCMWVK
jgi:DNA-directed RNA polymerase subunit E"